MLLFLSIKQQELPRHQSAGSINKFTSNMTQFHLIRESNKRGIDQSAAGGPAGTGFYTDTNQQAIKSANQCNGLIIVVLDDRPASAVPLA